MVDHYDVLGIRPNAKLIEIELAFRGRRTQYHPDRYDQSDLEAVRWATKKMQEVNEAFAVLSDPDQRRVFDAGRVAPASPRNEAKGEPAAAQTSPSSRATGFSDASESDGQEEPDLLSYLSKLRLAGDDKDRFHLHPHINPRIRSNVYSARKWVRGYYGVKKLLCVLDDTLAGGCKEGIAVTETTISFKSIFADSVDYHYVSGFRDRLHVHRDAIYLQNEAVKSFVHVRPASLEAFCFAFNSYLQDFESWHLGRAKRGVVESQFFMSSAAPYDSEEALYWLQLAAESGHRSAQHNLACKVQSRDPEAAFYWFSEAARQGSDLSKSRLKDSKFDRFGRVRFFVCEAVRLTDFPQRASVNLSS